MTSAQGSHQKDIDSLVQVLQVPLDGAQAVSELIGGPVHFLLGGSTSFLHQLGPSVMEALCCVHCFLHLPVTQQQAVNKKVKKSNLHPDVMDQQDTWSACPRRKEIKV